MSSLPENHVPTTIINTAAYNIVDHHNDNVHHENNNHDDTESIGSGGVMRTDSIQSFANLVHPDQQQQQQNNNTRNSDYDNENVNSFSTNQSGAENENKNPLEKRDSLQTETSYTTTSGSQQSQNQNQTNSNNNNRRSIGHVFSPTSIQMAASDLYHSFAGNLHDEDDETAHQEWIDNYRRHSEQYQHYLPNSSFVQSMENPLRKPLPFSISSGSAHYLQQLMLLDKKRNFLLGKHMANNNKDDDDDNAKQLLSLREQISTLIQHVPSPSSWLLSDFEVRAAIIGSGALGKVYLCRLKQQPISVEYGTHLEEENQQNKNINDDDHDSEDDEMNRKTHAEKFPRFNNGYHSLPNPFFAMKIMKKHELIRLRQTNRVIREARIQQRIACANLRSYYVSFFSAIEREDNKDDEEEEEEEEESEALFSGDDDGDGDGNVENNNDDDDAQSQRSAETLILPAGKQAPPSPAKMTNSPANKKTGGNNRRKSSSAHSSLSSSSINNKTKIRALSTTSVSNSISTRGRSSVTSSAAMAFSNQSSSSQQRRRGVKSQQQNHIIPPAFKPEMNQQPANKSSVAAKEDLDFVNNTDGLLNRSLIEKKQREQEEQESGNNNNNEDTEEQKRRMEKLEKRNKKNADRHKKQQRSQFLDSIIQSIAPTLDPAASFFVSLFRTFSDEKRVYFILEHAAGGELFARLKNTSKFPVDVARFYAAQLVIAIDYLHSKEKTVFRDLQPDNLLLDGAGHLKICDFGNSKCLSLQESTYYNSGNEGMIMMPHHNHSNQNNHHSVNQTRSSVASSIIPAAAKAPGSRRYGSGGRVNSESTVNSGSASAHNHNNNNYGGEQISLLDTVSLEYQRNQFLFMQEQAHKNADGGNNQNNNNNVYSFTNMSSTNNRNNNSTSLNLNNNNNDYYSNSHQSAAAVRTFTICGVPEYTAPEIVATAFKNNNNNVRGGGDSPGPTTSSPGNSRPPSPAAAVDNTSRINQSSSIVQGHSFAVDWWSVGIILFEMLAGYPPFFDDVPNKIFEKAANANRDSIPFPNFFDTRTKDLITGLLNPDPSKRMGSLKRGATDIMKHRFFAGIDWTAMRKKQVQPPDFIRESLFSSSSSASPGVIPSSVLRKAHAQAPASSISTNLPMNNTNSTAMMGSSKKAKSFLSSAQSMMKKKQQDNNDDPFFDNNEEEDYDEDDFDSTLPDSPESLRKKEFVSADIADMFLGFPYDKYPETEQTANNNNNNQDNGGNVPGGISQKPLTEQQQAVFEVFG